MKACLNLRPHQLFKNILLATLLILSAFSCKINEEWDDCLEECDGPGLKETKYEEVIIEPFIKDGDSQVTDFSGSICSCDFGLNLNFEYTESVIQPAVRECCGYEYELADGITNVNLFVIDTENDEKTNVSDDFQLTNPINDGTTLKELSDRNEEFYFEYMIMELAHNDPMPAASKFYVELVLSSGEVLTFTTEEILFSQEGD